MCDNRVCYPFCFVTLFSGFFDSALSSSILARGRDSGVISFDFVDIRAFSEDKHHRVDDSPYGGGSGMLMQAGPLVGAIEEACRRYPEALRIFLGPKGRRYSQRDAERYSGHEGGLILVCGHYEGIDERVMDYIDEEVSIGDYILTGGEVGALVILDSVARLRSGVLGNMGSLEEESFSDGLLEYPQYTRPLHFRGECVPDVLLSGHHGEISKWRRRERLRGSFFRRPDLIARGDEILRKEAMEYISSLGYEGLIEKFRRYIDNIEEVDVFEAELYQILESFKEKG